ncbi:unnamed protein product [Arctogadus glacialis]
MDFIGFVFPVGGPHLGLKSPTFCLRDSRLQRLLLADTFCPGTTETFLLSEDPGRGGHGIPECYVVSDSYRLLTITAITFITPPPVGVMWE